MDQKTSSQHDEISLVEIASVALQHRKTIFLVLFVSLSFSVVQALLKPTLYTSSASFFPEGSNTGLGGAAALAQQFGFSLPGGGGRGERTPRFYQDLILSNELLRGVVAQPFSLRSESGEVEEINLVTHFEIVAATEDEGTQRAIETLREAMRVGNSAETGIVSLSVTTSDPGLSEQLAGSILEGIYDFDRQRRQSQARAERIFAEERLAEVREEFLKAEDELKTFLMDNRLFTNSPQLQFEHDRLLRTVQMRQEIVTTLRESVEATRIEEVRNTPLVTVLEYPRVPALRDPKGRIRLVFQGGVIGLILGGLIAFLNHYRLQALKRNDPQLDELSTLWSDTIRGFMRLGRTRPQ